MRRLPPVMIGRVAVASVAALILASCAGGGDDPASGDRASAREAAATTTTEPECGPGGRTVVREGRRIREFCGPGRARVVVGSETFAFTGGECRRTRDAVEVHLGAEAVEPGAGAEITEPQFASFTLLMGRHAVAPGSAVPVPADGAYTAGTLTFTVPGRSWVVDDKTVTLVASRTAGTFSGVALAFGAPAEGRSPEEGPDGGDEDAGDAGDAGDDEGADPGGRPDGADADDDAAGAPGDEPDGEADGGDTGEPAEPGTDVAGAFTCDDGVIPLDSVPERAGTAPPGPDDGEPDDGEPDNGEPGDGEPDDGGGSGAGDGADATP